VASNEDSSKALVRTFAGAVAAGVGVIGFTTLVGAILIWIPLHDVGLPASNIIETKPRVELLTVGASFLVPFVAAATIILLVLFGARTLCRRRWPPQQVPTWVDWIRDGAATEVEGEERGGGPRPAKRGARAVVARDPALVVDSLCMAVVAGLAFYLVWRVHLIPARDHPSSHLTPLLLVATVGIVALLGTMAVRVTNPTSFFWFAATFLLAAFAFGATLNIAHSGAFPRIQAAAVLRKGSDRGVRGYYVAETSDRIYLARITVVSCGEGARGDAQDARLMVLPRDNVIGLSIGSPMDPCDAKAASTKLLTELRLDIQTPTKLPNPQITPGVVNPNVRQETIRETICHAGWADAERPPTRYTSELKLEQMKQYGDKGPPSDYEEDYLFPLSLGGAARNPKNLWPEPQAQTRESNPLEQSLRSRVCRQKITLAKARAVIRQYKFVHG
jgi:hypothetical protein